MGREDLIRELQQKYREAGSSLNELERRQWAASEAMTLGRGGIAMVSRALRMSPNTIKRGMQELVEGRGSQDGSRIRKAGGGRKSRRSSADRGGAARKRRASPRDASN